MTASLEEALNSVSVTRLAHFTPTMNLWPILRDGFVRSSEQLRVLAPKDYAATDPMRWDGHPNHICCTFEYPNVHYMINAASKKDEFKNYRDWAVLLIDPALILRGETLFSGCNAARDRGAHLAAGPDALLRCWADPSVPQGIRRGLKHSPAAPTDMQAEVLVAGPIPLSDVSAIVVRDDAVAAELYALFDTHNLRPDRVEWKVSPTFFDVNALRDGVRDGGAIMETTWTPEGAA